MSAKDRIKQFDQIVTESEPLKPAPRRAREARVVSIIATRIPRLYSTSLSQSVVVKCMRSRCATAA